MQRLVEFLRMDRSSQGREGAALGIWEVELERWVQGIEGSACPFFPWEKKIFLKNSQPPPKKGSKNILGRNSGRKRLWHQNVDGQGWDGES